jgi:hypothetical protein
MSQTTAQRAFAQATGASRAALDGVYRQQVAEYRAQAEQALREVIWPWYRAFAASEPAARIRLAIQDRRLLRPHISEHVAYRREDGRSWEAYVFLEADETRHLRPRVRQLLEGREPGGAAHAMFLHQEMRFVPLDEAGLIGLDLHPIVLVDFAEQIAAHGVTAHIQELLERLGRKADDGQPHG